MASDTQKTIHYKKGTGRPMVFAPELNEAQKAIFCQFKKATEDCKPISDEYLIKWLVAKNFDLELSEKMLRRSLEWREANFIDEILDRWEPPKVLVNYYPLEICGKDKYSCPVSIVNFGRADWIGMLQSVSKRDYLRYIVYLAEKSRAEMRKHSLKSEIPITYETFIIDMEELSMRQISFKPFREVGIKLVKMLEANYPETFRKIFVVNAPKVFAVVFNMVKPFLNQATNDKISVFDSDKDVWKAALLKEIDASQLPARYGGNNMTIHDGFPECPTKFTRGSEVPREYYLESTRPLPKNYMTHLTIPRGAKRKLEYKIVAANSLLRWEFMTENGDIGFSVYYFEMNGDRFDVMTSERIQSDTVMEEGEIFCVRPVLYVLEFDNGYSYLRSKKLWYRVAIDMPAC